MVGTHSKLNFYRIMLSILTNTVELSHEWILINFKYQEPEFYARIFDESEDGYFEVPPGCIKVGIIRKLLPNDPKLYIFRLSIVLSCSVHFRPRFLWWKITLDHFRYDIIPSLKANY